MRPVSQYISLITHMGAGWMLYRAGYAARRRLGFLRRATPVVPWEQVPVPELSLHPQPKPSVPDSWGRAIVDEAEAILQGEFRLFSHRVVTAGFPPDWTRNQLDQIDGPQVSAKNAEPQVSGFRFQVSQKHWSEISDFGGGDIKGIWELSRFPWAFALTRAYARTGDARYAEGFWKLFVDWCGKNPPNTGPNWMCGQEATFRLMAVVFAAETFGVPEASKQGLARFLEATGRRISANLDYALSQKNNHGVSECIGLITVALLLANQPEAKAWLRRGLQDLHRQLRELVYEDGGFSQHSLIYHRVLLHDLCWCWRRLELAGLEIPEWLHEAGKRALGFLMTITDTATGQAPLYGSNDGANVLPLSDADFLDLRPVIQMVAAVFRGELPLPAGPWDEAVAWLRNDWDSLPRKPWPPPPKRWHAPVSGCFQLMQGGDKLFLRCPTRFRHRPAQADMLHVDIWHDGLPIAFDGGSFSYNSSERFRGMGMASHHNVLTIDGLEPLQKFNRFLYLPWPKGEAMDDGQGGFQARHDGYATCGVRWTRTVKHREAGGWLIHDRISGAAGRPLQWHWRLADRPWSLDDKTVSVLDAAGRYRIHWLCNSVAKTKLVRADPASAYGWWSPHYAEAEPAYSLLIQVFPAADEVEFQTEFTANG